MKKICGRFVFGSSLFLLLAAVCFGQVHFLKEESAKKDLPLLQFGQTIEREFTDSQFYRLSLEAGQFVRIEVLQTDCDVVLMVMSPSRQNIHEVRNETSGQGLETAGIAAPVSGDYELRLLSFSKPKPTSRFALKIAELRPATEKELNFTAGTGLLNEGFNLGTSNASAESLRQAILLLEKAVEKFRAAGDVNQESMTYNNIAVRFERLGDRRKAIEYFQLSLKGFRSINARADEGKQLNNLGAVYSSVGEWQKAFEVLFDSITIFTEIKDERGEAFSLSKIGVLYEGIGDRQKAETYYRRAAKSFEGLDEPYNQALEVNKLGKIVFAAGEFAEALKLFQQALGLANQAKNRNLVAFETGIRRTEAVLSGNIGRTYFALGEQDKGLTYLNESLGISRSLGDKTGEAATLRNLGQIHLSLDETDKSIEFLNQSLLIYRSVEDAQNSAETLLLLSKTEAKKGDLETAQSNAEEAINLVESIRRRVQTAELRDSFSANLQDFYGFYGELLMQRDKKEPDKNYAVLAFQANERRKARGLLNLLTEANANIREGADTKLLAKESELKDLLSARLENLTKVLSGKSKPEIVESLKIEIEQIRSEYEQTKTQIRVSSPRYAALLQPKTLDLKEIQTEVLDSDSVLLEYALGKDKSYLWIVSKNDLRTVELPARAEIEDLARRFYESLTARNKEIKFETDAERQSRILKADTELPKLSEQLSKQILAPAAPFLGNKRLLIVADGALQYVPFGSLGSLKTGNIEQRTIAEKRFLIETNEIVNLPSASVLAVLRRELKGRRVAPKTLAVLADPVFDMEDQRFQAISGKNDLKTEYVALSKKRTRAGGQFSTTRDGLDLPRLPFTRREADLISAAVPANQREKMLDFSASRSSAMSPDLSNFRYVHFATHGFINNENPELSGLVFSMINENGREQDGFLRVGDIYNLRLPAELVVLSGCRTGLGKEIKGEGLIGLTRGFMYSGAKRVAVSLWDVNDEATSELMGHFYREMLGGKKLSPASALRQAQIKMIGEKRWQNPYYWAAFTLQGEPL